MGERRSLGFSLADTKGFSRSFGFLHSFLVGFLPFDQFALVLRSYSFSRDWNYLSSNGGLAFNRALTFFDFSATNASRASRLAFLTLRSLVRVISDSRASRWLFIASTCRDTKTSGHKNVYSISLRRSNSRRGSTHDAILCERVDTDPTNKRGYEGGSFPGLRECRVREKSFAVMSNVSDGDAQHPAVALTFPGHKSEEDGSPPRLSIGPHWSRDQKERLTNAVKKDSESEVLRNRSRFRAARMTARRIVNQTGKRDEVPVGRVEGWKFDIVESDFPNSMRVSFRREDLTKAFVDARELEEIERFEVFSDCRNPRTRQSGHASGYPREVSATHSCRRALKEVCRLRFSRSLRPGFHRSTRPG